MPGSPRIFIMGPAKKQEQFVELPRITKPTEVLEAIMKRTYSSRSECRFEGLIIRNNIMKKEGPSGGDVPYRTLPATFTGVHSLVHNLTFYRCDIQNGVFDRSYLFFTEFGECDLKGASFSGSGTCLISTSFRGSDMAGASVRYADAEGADFSNLKSATGLDFLGTNIAGAMFFGTDLRETKNLPHAKNLDFADFRGAMLTEAQELAIKDAARERIENAMRKESKH